MEGNGQRCGADWVQLSADVLREMQDWRAQHPRATLTEINTSRALAPNMPFGGYKASGIGRENGLDAVRNVTQAKGV